MKIKSMYATFGNLVNRELHLSDGLNIISGDNESGKSTWSAFLRAMLFGISTREQSKTGYLAEKERYLPWSSEPMYGRIEFTDDDRALVMERTSGKNRVFSKLSVTDSVNGLAVSELEEAPGELLLGVKKEVFERSAFIGQANLSVDNDKNGELHRRILSLAGSGDETVSYKIIADRLEKWKRARKYNRRGQIPELENECVEIEEKLIRLRRDAAELTLKHTQLEKLQSDEREYARQAEIWKSVRAWEQIDLNENADSEEQAAQVALDNAEKAATYNGFTPDEAFITDLKNLVSRLEILKSNHANGGELVQNSKRALIDEQERLRRFDFFENAGKADAEAIALKDAVEYRAAQDKLKKNNLPLVWSAFFGAVVIALAIMYALFIPDANIVITSILISAPIAIILALGIAGNRKAAKLRAVCAQLLAKYRAADADEFSVRAQEYSEQLRRVADADNVAALAENDSQRGNEMLCLLEKDILTKAHMLSEDAVLDDVPSIIERVCGALQSLADAKSALISAQVRARAIREGRNSEELLRVSAQFPKDTQRPTASEAEISAKLSYIERMKRELELDCSAITARMGVGGDIGELEERERIIHEAVAGKEAEYDALLCAINALEQANGELCRRFAPALEKKAAEIFEFLTGGKFKIVHILSPEMQLEVSQNSAAQSRDVLELSAGTLDELYFALRLALCETVLDASAPIIMDDALVNFDNTRMSRALEYLRHLSKSRQILLFTCHTREAEYFAGGNDALLLRI